jgi:hypothetical protein
VERIQSVEREGRTVLLWRHPLKTKWTGYCFFFQGRTWEIGNRLLTIEGRKKNTEMSKDSPLSWVESNN